LFKGIQVAEMIEALKAGFLNFKFLAGAHFK
jgi:hypothetical protein